VPVKEASMELPKLSRRWFLLGSAGAIAAAAVPPAVVEVVKIILPEPPKLSHRYYSRMLFGIDYAYGHPGELFFYRPGETDPFFNVVCVNGDTCLWVSHPGSRLPFPKDASLVMDFKTIDTTDWPGPGKVPNPPSRGRPGRIYRDDIPLSTLAGSIMLAGARVFEDGHEEGFSEVYKLPLVS